MTSLSIVGLGKVPTMLREALLKKKALSDPPPPKQVKSVKMRLATFR